MTDFSPPSPGPPERLVTRQPGDPMKILIATDAWEPQVNGVVRTLSHLVAELEAMGDEVHVLSHEGRRTFAMPSYPEIRLAFPSRREVAREIAGFAPDAIHVATEGPIGSRVRRHCIHRRLPFTTSYHSRFPEFVSARLPLPGIERGLYALLRAFHGPARAVLSPTPSISRDLEARGFTRVLTWTRGVDHAVFRPHAAHERAVYEGDGPFLVHVGRLAAEKNVEAFLSLDVSGTKIVIGDGPERARLERRYPKARFLGYRFGADLARHIAGGDVFVFPSRSDTFGLVMIEAMACGLPVAAYPVPGPIDVVEHGRSGWLDEDLARAVRGALALDPAEARARAAGFTWTETARQFRETLERLPARSQSAGSGIASSSRSAARACS